VVSDSRSRSTRHSQTEHLNGSQESFHCADILAEFPDLPEMTIRLVTPNLSYANEPRLPLTSEDGRPMLPFMTPADSMLPQVSHVHLEQNKTQELSPRDARASPSSTETTCYSSEPESPYILKQDAQEAPKWKSGRHPLLRSFFSTSFSKPTAIAYAGMLIQSFTRRNTRSNSSQSASSSSNSNSSSSHVSHLVRSEVNLPRNSSSESSQSSDNKLPLVQSPIEIEQHNGNTLDLSGRHRLDAPRNERELEGYSVSATNATSDFPLSTSCYLSTVERVSPVEQLFGNETAPAPPCNASKQRVLVRNRRQLAEGCQCLEGTNQGSRSEVNLVTNSLISGPATTTASSPMPSKPHNDDLASVDPDFNKDMALTPRLGYKMTGAIRNRDHLVRNCKSFSNRSDVDLISVSSFSPQSAMVKSQSPVNATHEGKTYFDMEMSPSHGAVRSRSQLAKLYHGTYTDEGTEKSSV
jgi:hypothetical protein